ncbi:MAG: hydrolase [Deltaproteobacteria bacterium]|nr:hydrolase [Deltaproteobacteria bacterium]
MSDRQLSPSPLLRGDDAILVVIDMQERLLPVISDKDKVIENIQKLVKFSRMIGLPIILTEQGNLGETNPEIRTLLKGVEPITKLEFDCFESPAFAEHVGQSGRNTLIIAGIEAHICVAQTALHALAHHRVHVVSDAVSSRSPHNREVALSRMRESGLTITSTEMVIFELLGKAGTDQFKEALKLVK